MIAFAVAVTGLATLLNGVFGCHIAIEGTEAPADVRGGIILLCLALTILLCLLPFVHARLSQLLSTYRLLILPYLALTLGTFGGVYIAGGIVPRFLDFFKASGFRGGFEDKGRFKAYVQDIPVYLIVHDNPGLLGAGAHLRQTLGHIL